MLRITQQTSIRPMTDEERDALAGCHRLCRKFLADYDDDTQQDGMILVISNWVRNREKNPGIKNTTFAANSAKFAGASAKRFSSRVGERFNARMVRFDAMEDASNLLKGQETCNNTAEAFRTIRLALWQLPVTWRKVMRLKLDGCSDSEVASELDLSRSRIGQIVRGSVQKLKGIVRE